MSGDVAAFCAARLDEDEAAAKAASSGHLCPQARGGRWQVVGDRHVRYDNGCGETHRAIDVTGGPCLWYEQIRVVGDPDGVVAAHVARHDPHRALSEVAAGRALLADYAEANAARAAWEADESEWDGAPEEWADRGASLRHVADTLFRQVKLRAAVWSAHPDYQPQYAPAA